jgi:hypothetical protein
LASYTNRKARIKERCGGSYLTYHDGAGTEDDQQLARGDPQLLVHLNQRPTGDAAGAWRSGLRHGLAAGAADGGVAAGRAVEVGRNDLDLGSARRGGVSGGMLGQKQSTDLNSF